jgi:hypothetical protein
MVGFLTTLTTSEGIICSDWRTVDTGPASADSASSHSALSSEALRELPFDEVTLGDKMAALSPTLNPQAKGQSYQANTGPLLNAVNGHYYEAVSVPEGIDWSRAGLEAAQRKFQGFSGHIATVTSQQENSFIATNFPEIAGELGYWLGGLQHLDTTLFDKGWRWVTGESMGYMNWHAGEPNAPGGPDAIHYYTSSGEWSDRPVTDPVSGYVVEYEPTCSLDMDLNYEHGTLNLSISASEQEPTKWNLWLVMGRRMIPIVSAKGFPDNESQLNFSMSTPFPHSGRLGFLATLTAANGVVCSEWKTVEASPQE